MANNQVRKDYLLNRWVVIANERKKRPTDFIKKEISEKDGDCPFCPDNEKMTPPAKLVYISNDGKLEKKQDRDNFRYKNWLVRVIPNLYPAFFPPANENVAFKKSCNLIDAVGHHEVIVETPCHDEHLGIARLSQIVYIIEAYLDRLTFLFEKPYVKHITIFKNHGREAGASLSHPHTQLIASHRNCSQRCSVRRDYRRGIEGKQRLLGQEPDLHLL